MKNYLITLILLSITTYSFSQNINFEDLNFKNKLLSSSPQNQIAKNLNGNFFAIDSNSDGEISFAEALQTSYLDISNSSINSLLGIIKFSNLKYLNCSGNVMSKLYLYDDSTGENLHLLEELNTSGNFPLMDLDIRNLYNLSIINVAGNSLSNTSIYYPKFENVFSIAKKLDVSFNNFTDISTSSIVIFITNI